MSTEYIKRAAGHLAAKRYITLKDGKALIAAARIEPLPLPPADDDGNGLVGEREPNSTIRVTSSFLRKEEAEWIARVATCSY